MLQRMQSIWLLLAAVCAFLTIRFSFYSGNIELSGQPKAFLHLNAAANFWLLILAIVIISAVVINIFLYKNRKLQLRICIAALLISLLNIFIYYKQTQKFIEGSYDLTAVFTLLIPLFLVFAMRGINKDEKLIKSLNRLR